MINYVNKGSCMLVHLCGMVGKSIVCKFDSKQTKKDKKEPEIFIFDFLLEYLFFNSEGVILRIFPIFQFRSVTKTI